MGNSNSSLVERPLYNPQDYLNIDSFNDIRYGKIKLV